MSRVAQNLAMRVLGLSFVVFKLSSVRSRGGELESPSAARGAVTAPPNPEKSWAGTSRALSLRPLLATCIHPLPRLVTAYPLPCFKTSIQSTWSICLWKWREPTQSVAFRGQLNLV